MMRTMPKRAAAVNVGTCDSGVGRSETGEEWEMRPGGMLVQKRVPDSSQISGHPPPPPIRIRVKHGSIYHEITINAQATFGELKKMLSGPTGLHHQDQKLVFKNKERDSNAFLDIVGVKDKSKVILVEDPLSHERRRLELRKTAKMEKASKTISDISFEVDRLAGRVSALDSVISRGGKIAETAMLGLIELLMNQLLKLDGINADGDVKLQRKMQVRRVQKYVETLDALKIKNAANTGGQAPTTVDTHKSTGVQQRDGQRSSDDGYCEPNRQENHQQVAAQPPRQSASGTVVTTQWETFDMIVDVPPQTVSASTSTNNPVHPKFPWEFFD